jgi:hypothetical protein
MVLQIKGRHRQLFKFVPRSEGTLKLREDEVRDFGGWNWLGTSTVKKLLL